MNNPFETPRIEAKPIRNRGNIQAIAEGLHDTEQSTDEKKGSDNMQKLLLNHEHMYVDEFSDYVFYVLNSWKELSNCTELATTAASLLLHDHADSYAIVRCFSETDSIPSSDFIEEFYTAYRYSSPAAVYRLLAIDGVNLPTEKQTEYTESLKNCAEMFTQERISQMDEYFLDERYQENPINEVRLLYEAMGDTWTWSQHTNETEAVIGAALRHGAVRFAESIEQAREDELQNADTELLTEDVYKMYRRHKEDIKKGIEYMLDHHINESGSFENSILKLEADTGIKPDWHNTKLITYVQEELRKSTKSYSTDRYFQIKTLTGISLPHEEEEEFFQGEYAHILNRYTYYDDPIDTAQIDAWARTTGTPIQLTNKAVVDAIYNRLELTFAGHEKGAVAKIQFFQKIAPDIASAKHIEYLFWRMAKTWDINGLAIHSDALQKLGIQLDLQDPAHRTIIMGLFVKSYIEGHGAEEADFLKKAFLAVLPPEEQGNNQNLNAFDLQKKIRATDNIEARKMIEKDLQDIANQLCNSKFDAQSVEKAISKWHETTGFLPNPLLIRVLQLKHFEENGSQSETITRLLQYLGVDTTNLPADFKQLSPTAPLRTSALIYQQLLPQKGEDRALAIQNFRSVSVLHDYIPDLLLIRGPSRRDEFCPYKNAVTPLFEQLHEYDLRKLEDAKTRKGLMAFFKTFGLVNLPTLANTIIDITACDDIDKKLANQKLNESKSPFIKMALDLLEIDPTEASPSLLIEGIKNFRQRLSDDILSDKPLPQGTERNQLAMEIFNALIPHVGTYSSTGNRPDLIAKTRTNSMPKAPAFLTKRNVDVEVRQEGTDDEPINEQEKIKAIDEKILSKCKEESLQAFLAPWRKGMALERLESTEPAWWFGGLQARIEQSKKQLEQKLENVTNEKGRIAIQKQIAELDQLISAVQQTQKNMTESTLASVVDYRNQTIKLLRGLQSAFLDSRGRPDNALLLKHASPEAHALMFRLMRTTAHEHLNAVEEAERAGEPITILETWKRYFFEEYLEHFQRTDLPEQQLPADLVDLSLALWRTKGNSDALREAGMNKIGAPKHPLADVSRSYEALKQQKNKIINGEEDLVTTKLAFHPVMGIGRVLAGDIANACYNKQSGDLAEGKFPKLTALIMTLPDRQNEIAGSTLCIEARNTKNERILVIRALNPTEAVIQRELDPASTVNAVANYFIQSAEASNETDPTDPVCEVRLCYDHSGGHCTNRPLIFQAEGKLLQTKWKDHTIGKGLKLEPETRFNGYHIWNEHEARVIWRKI